MGGKEVPARITILEIAGICTLKRNDDCLQTIGRTPLGESVKYEANMAQVGESLYWQGNDRE